MRASHDAGSPSHLIVVANPSLLPSNPSYLATHLESTAASGEERVVLKARRSRSHPTDSSGARAAAAAAAAARLPFLYNQSSSLATNHSTIPTARHRHALSSSSLFPRVRAFIRGGSLSCSSSSGPERTARGEFSAWPDWRRAAGVSLAVYDVMWPLCFISDKLFKMPGDDAGEGPLPPNGQIPLARRSYSIDVPHVQQAFTWDCGLACVLMVLRTLGVDCCDGIAHLEKLCRTTSVWTVDLAYLLHEFSVVFSFFTVTIGANPQYSAESFYREQLQEDIDRVDDLFGKALDAGISIHCRSITAYDIAFLLLSGHCIAIALVDKSKLNSSWMNDVQDVQQFDEGSDYMGHYVVICGYDADACEFEIRDPASSRKREMVPMKSLDEARKSFGTDEDILLVSITGKNG